MTARRRVHGRGARCSEECGHYDVVDDAARAARRRRRRRGGAPELSSLRSSLPDYPILTSILTQILTLFSEEPPQQSSLQFSLRSSLRSSPRSSLRSLAGLFCNRTGAGAMRLLGSPRAATSAGAPSIHGSCGSQDTANRGSREISRLPPMPLMLLLQPPGARSPVAHAARRCGLLPDSSTGGRAGESVPYSRSSASRPLACAR